MPVKRHIWLFEVLEIGTERCWEEKSMRVVLNLDLDFERHQIVHE